MTTRGQRRALWGVVLLTLGALGAYALYVAYRGRAVSTPADRYRTWRAYGGGPEQIRYSSLRQINRSNVQQLKVVWTYDSGETGGLQTNPIVVDGTLYTVTPKHRVVALDASTAAVKWRFDCGRAGRGPNRGVTYWTDGTEGRIFTAQGPYVYALDASSGEPIPSFGTGGRIDLRENLGRNPDAQSVMLTTPGIIHEDLLIVGGRVSESLPAAPGDVRAYDARTGALRWSFHTIPHPGELGSETWPEDAWTYSGGANNWAGMALDAERGIVFVPTGSAAADFYGANRSGDNLFANSLLALDAATGERIWHFQTVRHDLWDRDLPSPPSLVTVTRGGRRVDAVAQTTKHGYVFLFDRTDGTPLFPIEYRTVPASPVDGEQTAETQPFPTKPSPFARQRLTKDMLTRRTPDAHRSALEAFLKMRSGGQFHPLVVGQQTVIFPGFDGGAEWGGSAFDPESGVLYVNANEMAWTGSLAPSEGGTSGRSIYLRDCAVCHRDDLTGAPPQIPSLVGIFDRKSPEEVARVVRDGAGRMPGFAALSLEELAALMEFMMPGRSAAIDAHDATSTSAALKYRFTGYERFLDHEGYPAVAPPWGTLTAIDLNSGDHVWQIPLGEYPELAAQGMEHTGSENYGGPVVTAGGLLFIGATSFDQKLRAFDKATGELLWEATLPFSGTGTPSTYAVNGRQFVVVPAGGGKSRGDESGGVYVAFALNEPSR